MSTGDACAHVEIEAPNCDLRLHIAAVERAHFVAGLIVDAVRLAQEVIDAEARAGKRRGAQMERAELAADSGLSAVHVLRIIAAVRVVQLLEGTFHECVKPSIMAESQVVGGLHLGATEFGASVALTDQYRWVVVAEAELKPSEGRRAVHHARGKDIREYAEADVTRRGPLIVEALRRANGVAVTVEKVDLRCAAAEQRESAAREKR